MYSPVAPNPRGTLLGLLPLLGLFCCCKTQDLNPGIRAKLQLR